MNAKLLLTFLVVAAVVAGPSASTRAADLGTSDFGVQLTNYEQTTVTDSGPVHAAFLSDAAVVPAQHIARSGMIHHGLNSGRGDECPECAMGNGAMGYGSMGNGSMGNGWHFGAGGECCSSCDCGSDVRSCSTCDGCSSGNCGGQSGCESSSELEGMGDVSDIKNRLLYGEVQVMWLRAHIMEDAIGKLSEQYKFSPRLIVGYEDPCGVGARVRYWHYDHTTETLDNDDFLHFQFDVMDAEMTSRFAVRKTDLVVSGGFRWASIDAGLDDETVNSNMIGLTVAADLRTQICGGCNRQWAGVAGARWSTLGGDWDGSSGGFLSPVRDDNMVVQELYAGVEYLCHTCKGHNIYARLTFELQNWHSDAASQLSGTDSIGFVGPGIHVGGSF